VPVDVSVLPTGLSGVLVRTEGTKASAQHSPMTLFEVSCALVVYKTVY
jgi:hypothetical protein